MEEWRDVIGWEGIYAVSSYGRIKRLAEGHSTFPGRILGISSRSDGYPFVRLRYMGRTQKAQVHKLVAEAFLGPRPPKYHVNHKDGDRANSRLDNLEYVTCSENHLHAYRSLGRKPSPSYGAANGSAKLTKDDVYTIRSWYAVTNVSQKTIAKMYGVSQRLVSLIIRNEIWTN